MAVFALNVAADIMTVTMAATVMRYAVSHNVQASVAHMKLN